MSLSLLLCTTDIRVFSLVSHRLYPQSSTPPHSTLFLNYPNLPYPNLKYVVIITVKFPCTMTKLPQSYRVPTPTIPRYFSTSPSAGTPLVASSWCCMMISCRKRWRISWLCAKVCYSQHISLSTHLTLYISTQYTLSTLIYDSPLLQ